MSARPHSVPFEIRTHCDIFQQPISTLYTRESCAITPRTLSHYVALTKRPKYRTVTLWRPCRLRRRAERDAISAEGFYTIINQRAEAPACVENKSKKVSAFCRFVIFFCTVLFGKVAFSSLTHIRMFVADSKLVMIIYMIVIYSRIFRKLSSFMIAWNF